MHEENIPVMLATVLPTAVLIESLLYAVRGTPVGVFLANACLILLIVVTKDVLYPNDLVTPMVSQ